MVPFARRLSSWFLLHQLEALGAISALGERGTEALAEAHAVFSSMFAEEGGRGPTPDNSVPADGLEQCPALALRYLWPLIEAQVLGRPLARGAVRGGKGAAAGKTTKGPRAGKDLGEVDEDGDSDDSFPLPVPEKEFVEEAAHWQTGFDHTGAAQLAGIDGQGDVGAFVGASGKSRPGGSGRNTGEGAVADFLCGFYVGNATSVRCFKHVVVGRSCFSS